MSVNCTTLGYSFNNEDFCLPITVTLDTDEFTIDSAWIAGAFFLGLFVGAGLTALCVRPFLIGWEKKKVCTDAAVEETNRNSYTYSMSIL